MTKTKRTVMAALLASLTCVATMIIKIPSPLNGYINLGDCCVLLSGFMLSPLYGFFAAGLGSALADMFSGFIVYVPATFLIKGIMALIAFFLYAALKKRIRKTPALIFSGAVAEVFMVLGYFVFEGFMYGFGASVVNIPSNAVQGAAGLLLGVFLVRLFKKHKISF